MSRITVTFDDRAAGVAVNDSMTIGHVVRDAALLLGKAPRERTPVHTLWIATRPGSMESLNLSLRVSGDLIASGISVERR